MDQILFDKFTKSTIGFAVASDLSDVPEEPGVYAWYLPLRGDSSSDLLHFLNSLQKEMAHSVMVTEMTATGQQRKFTVERNPPSFTLASSRIQGLSEKLTSSKLQRLANQVLVLSFFSEPIYVGMTEGQGGLRSRLKQHLQSVNSFDSDKAWTGDFRTRMAKLLGQSDYLKRCLILYMPLCYEDFGADIPRMLEHILIRTIRPSQSVRS